MQILGGTTPQPSSFVVAIANVVINVFVIKVISSTKSHSLPCLLENLFVRPVRVGFGYVVGAPVVLPQQQDGHDKGEGVLIDVRATCHPVGKIGVGVGVGGRGGDVYTPKSGGSKKCKGAMRWLRRRLAAAGWS